ncbi:MAG: serine hydrolase [Bacteroidetes bacterium]|nr:serine hydrolase [Bacteroidota bacterium]
MTQTIDLLKTFLYICLLAFLFACGNPSSGDKTTVDDSLSYYPPTPGTLNKYEFRRLYRELSGFLDTALTANKNFNGGILIAREGAVIYEKYNGLVDIRKKDSITPHTPFHIASTSKTFTAVAILRLIQQGRLSLNDSIAKFFPRLPYPGITVKMLLNHRSGLPNYLYFMSNNKWGMGPDGKWNKKMATNEDVLQMMIDTHPDKTGNPDGRFSYCNTNYVLLALIIEKITGQPYPAYMQQHIFTPLQMNDTYVFTLKDTLTATPSFTNRGVYWDRDFLDATYGDKNIYTTPRDLLKWDQALYTDQVLSKAWLDSAFAPYSFEKPSIHNYGLGWRLQLLPNGKKVVYHFGKWHGSNAAFARLMDEKATIIIIGNRFTRYIYGAATLCYDIFGEYLQGENGDTEESDSLKQSPAPEMKQKKKR